MLSLWRASLIATSLEVAGEYQVGQEIPWPVP
jgi:hypothetical protein